MAAQVRAIASGPDCPRTALHTLQEWQRGQHCFLEPADSCHYLWEYTPGRQCAGAGRWIGNLKCLPSQAAASPLRAIHKERALIAAADALRSALPRAWVEQATWCPIPPSRCCEDRDYDDRLLRVLRQAFQGYDADIRPLIRQSDTAPADHRHRRRLSLQALFDLTSVDARELARGPLRARLVLFDDLLTTGKHYKCAQRHLQGLLGPRIVIGCFLARRLLVASRCGRSVRDFRPS